MKKIGLILIGLLLFSSFSFASVAVIDKIIPNSNTFSFYYSSKRIEKDVGSERFWHLKTARLEWTGDNYDVDLDLAPLVAGNPISIKQAWIKFTPFKFMNISLGKITYPFCNVSSKTTCNITNFQPTFFGEDWMVKFNGEFGKLGWYAYWADGGINEGISAYDTPSTVGFRGKYSLAGFDIGASLRINDWDDDDRKYDWGADLLYELGNIAKFNLQVFNIDDDDDNSDLNFFLIASYEKGFILPFAKKTIPYLGYFSRNGIDDKGAKESNIVIGLNMKPVDNSFVKFEYNIDSDVGLKNLPEDNQNITNAISLEIGYSF
ncbi:MAG: hypothetical protein H8E22_05015 [Candidatus Cloacimonetes bacterium]|nr:hypothetical protein [Candidatus Cloacimonadota bacterium]